MAIQFSWILAGGTEREKPREKQNETNKDDGENRWIGRTEQMLLASYIIACSRVGRSYQNKEKSEALISVTFPTFITKLNPQNKTPKTFHMLTHVKSQGYFCLKPLWLGEVGLFCLYN